MRCARAIILELRSRSQIGEECSIGRNIGCSAVCYGHWRHWDERGITIELIEVLIIKSIVILVESYAHGRGAGGDG